MAPERFTKGEVDYLVAVPKFIRIIPRIEFLDPRNRTGWRIHTGMFLKSDPSKPISGLMVIAKAHQAPVGLPRPTPSVALEWYGKRIRGLNHEQWHDNPDGSIVRGWHEHLWSPQEQDAHVVQARPEPTRKELLDILKWGLTKWNIEVLEKQDDLRD